MELAEDVRHSPVGRTTYQARSETIERIFADAKEKHAMRYTHLRGLAKLKMQTLLTYAAMNLKKMARWKSRNEQTLIFSPTTSIFHKIWQKINPARQCEWGLSTV